MSYVDVDTRKSSNENANKTCMPRISVRGLSDEGCDTESSNTANQSMTGCWYPVCAHHACGFRNSVAPSTPYQNIKQSTRQQAQQHNQNRKQPHHQAVQYHAMGWPRQLLKHQFIQTQFSQYDGNLQLCMYKSGWGRTTQCMCWAWEAAQQHVTQSTH